MKRMKWLALLAVFALVVAACGDDDTGATGDFAGEAIAIFGAFETIEADAANAVISSGFNADTGAEAFYEGSGSFDSGCSARISCARIAGSASWY